MSEVLQYNSKNDTAAIKGKEEPFVVIHDTDNKSINRFVCTYGTDSKRS